MPNFAILKSFTFSRDGVTPVPATVGSVADIPAELVVGLVAEGYIEAKAIEAASENKMLRAAPENKHGRRK